LQTLNMMTLHQFVMVRIHARQLIDNEHVSGIRHASLQSVCGTCVSVLASKLKYVSLKYGEPSRLAATEKAGP
jgi:hypothetical protein